ncbi:MAG: hypothetical protein U0Q15_12125 [Kineosporiaceae bacterium]
MTFLSRLRRSPSLPADVAGRLDLRGERVLAWAPLRGEGHVVATAARLLAEVDGRTLARPWSEVDHAEFENETEQLVVWWVDGGRVATMLDLDGAGRVPEVVHERVRASVLATTQISLGPRRYLSVALRRGPDGELTTQASPGPGVRLDDPEIAALVEAASRRLREDAGQ